MTPGDARSRLRQAESYLAAADLLVSLGDDAEVDTVANICGHALGARWG